jgi:hypothetical protein
MLHKLMLVEGVDTLLLCKIFFVRVLHMHVSIDMIPVILVRLITGYSHRLKGAPFLCAAG